jgi:hypothetical protein
MTIEEHANHFINEIDKAAHHAYKASAQILARSWALEAVDLFRQTAVLVALLPPDVREEYMNRAAQHVARAWKNAAEKPY